MLNKYFTILLTLLCFNGFLSGQETTWVIDTSRSEIGFISKIIVSEVDGHFTDYSSSIKTSGDQFDSAHIQVSIQAKSINTENNKRDDHLRSEDFLYVEKYPEITFKSLSFTKSGEDMFTMKGEFTIRGITKEEVFEAEYLGLTVEGDHQRAEFKVTGSINRFDYNVDLNSLFSKGIFVGKEIEILCPVTLVTVNQ